MEFFFVPSVFGSGQSWGGGGGTVWGIKKYRNVFESLHETYVVYLKVLMFRAILGQTWEKGTVRGDNPCFWEPA